MGGCLNSGRRVFLEPTNQHLKPLLLRTHRVACVVGQLPRRQRTNLLRGGHATLPALPPPALAAAALDLSHTPTHPKVTSDAPSRGACESRAPLHGAWRHSHHAYRGLAHELAMWHLRRWALTLVVSGSRSRPFNTSFSTMRETQRETQWERQGTHLASCHRHQHQRQRAPPVAPRPHPPRVELQRQLLWGGGLFLASCGMGLGRAKVVANA
jgi:hypothetical protein